MPPPQDARHPSAALRPLINRSTQGVAHQLARFTGIGVVMTLAYLALYVLVRGTLGAQGANVVAWVATAIVDTAANRRLTFGLSGRPGAVRAQVEGLVVFGIGMVLTSGSLLALDALVSHPAELLEMGVLIVANVLAGLLRFSLLRHWVFAPRRHLDPTMASPPPSQTRNSTVPRPAPRRSRRSMPARTGTLTDFSAGRGRCHELRRPSQNARTARRDVPEGGRRHLRNRHARITVTHALTTTADRGTA